MEASRPARFAFLHFATYLLHHREEFVPAPGIIVPAACLYALGTTVSFEFMIAAAQSVYSARGVVLESSASNSAAAGVPANSSVRDLSQQRRFRQFSSAQRHCLGSFELQEVTSS